MRSMTGYGLGESSLGNTRIAVEARSLNHRYLEVRVRTSPELAEHAFLLEQLCREKLTRGRYDVSARYIDGSEREIELDVQRAKRWYTELQQLGLELAPGEKLPLSVLANLPGLFNGPHRANVEATREALHKALQLALTDLDKMREVEGRALALELITRLGAARQLCDQIAGLGSELVLQYQARLKERLAKLLAGTQTQVDPGRMEAELALLADRSDITEELVRLASHFEQFAALIALGEPVGRRLDFLLQEIGRETNTVGSKSQDASLSHRVVELKSEVERMREQVQNVE